MDTGSSIGAITYKLWEHYLTSLKLVFLMSKMEMAIISRLKYFRKKCKRCEFARELGTQKVPSFSFFFSVKNGTWRNKLGLWEKEAGELQECEAGEYWLSQGGREDLHEEVIFQLRLSACVGIRLREVGVCCWRHREHIRQVNLLPSPFLCLSVPCLVGVLKWESRSKNDLKR